MRLVIVASVLLVASALPACATYEEELSRSQSAFDQNEHERALAILRVLEPDSARLSVGDRAHYAYLRGMTDYRIGYRLEARHWLSIGAAIEQQTPGSLPPDSVKRMNEALKELNESVYSAGVASLSNDMAAEKSKSAGGDDTTQDTDTTPAKDSDAPSDKKKKTDQ
jgi:hypothetical protein